MSVASEYLFTALLVDYNLQHKWFGSSRPHEKDADIYAPRASVPHRKEQLPLDTDSKYTSHSKLEISVETHDQTFEFLRLAV